MMARESPDRHLIGTSVLEPQAFNCLSDELYPEAGSFVTNLRKDTLKILLDLKTIAILEIAERIFLAY